MTQKGRKDHFAYRVSLALAGQLRPRASKRVLQRLSENFSEIERVDQFRIALEDDSSPSESNRINSERGRQRLYEALNVPIKHVSRLEEKFSDTR